MSDERMRRVGQNEALFRHANERIEELNDTFALMTGTFSIACECGNALCTEQVTVPRNVYERIRQDAARFILKPGHDIDDTERVVERDQAGTFIVVEKHSGEPTRIAEETDPRG